MVAYLRGILGSLPNPSGTLEDLAVPLESSSACANMASNQEHGWVCIRTNTGWIN